MASEPVDTCWILPQTPDGVDDGEIVQKEWSISLRSKLKANRASPQTSFGPRHFNSQLFSASLARLRPPPVSTKPTKPSCLVFSLHHPLTFGIIDYSFLFFATTLVPFVVQLASESLRVIVAEGLSSAPSASSAIVFCSRGGYIHLFTYFHLRKLARLLWPPLFAPGPQKV